MQIGINKILLFPFLCLIASSWRQVDARSLPGQYQSQLQAPSYNHEPSHRSPATWLRDKAIETIWSTSKNAPKNAHCKLPAVSKISIPRSLEAKYGGDTVLRFRISNEEEAEQVVKAANTLFLDVWDSSSGWVDIRLAKEVVSSLLDLLPKNLQKAHTSVMKDLARAIFESHPLYPQHDANITNCSADSFTPIIRSRPDETNVFFGDYQPLSVIVPWMKLMGSLFSSHVQVIKVGTSYEGRDIPAFRLGVHPTNSKKPFSRRKSIIISGGIHAREWISTATVNYVAFSLMSSYGKSKDVTKLLEQFDWIFIPTLNPDGYVYTWEQDRLWRKNRQNTTLSLCRGLDLDRTYPYQWDGHSTLSNPCSESFAGEEPLDAVESVQFASWIKETEKNGTDVVGFLDLHSYSQQILYPYAYSCIDTPPSMENLEELALGLGKAIHAVSGEVYGVTSACEGYSSTRKESKANHTWTKFESGGGSVLDWMYHEMRVKYAYQLKLRDTGSYGFLLPAKNIMPTGREILAAVTYFGKFLMSDKGIESIVGPELEDSEIFDPGMTYIPNSEAAERNTASTDPEFEES